MKIASYKSTRAGWVGVFNRLIRLRLRSKYSHTEVVFEPGDGVDSLMPDGTCNPDKNGALWCVSASATDSIPNWAPRRAGKSGGVRFKRILPDTTKWDYDEVKCRDAIAVAKKARELEGHAYDWSLVFGYIVWVIPQSPNRRDCSETAAELLGNHEPWRLDPASIVSAYRRDNL